MNMQTDKIKSMRMGPKPQIRPLPDIFYHNGKKYQIQERGRKSYTIRALDDFVWQYRCLERIIKDSPVGFIEVLQDNQKYERFLDMESCEAHFIAHEKGEIPLMLPPPEIERLPASNRRELETKENA